MASTHLPPDVNLSSRNFFREIVWMFSIIVGVILGIYVGLGVAIDKVVVRISPETEQWLLEHIMPRYVEDLWDNDSSYIAGEGKELVLQNFLDQIATHSSFQELSLKVELVDKDVINAAAVPGGRIIVFTGLLRELESENELVFILGHEVGHFINRDHLRIFGRKLVLAVISLTLLGDTNDVTKFLARVLGVAEVRFSRHQEESADIVGIDALVALYGHAGGATDFFRLLNEKYPQSKAVEFLMTHPHPENRIAELEQIIRQKQYTVGELKPIPEALVQK